MTVDLVTQTTESRGLAVADPEAAAGALAHILATGDLSKLSNEQRVAFYLQRCSSLGLNPLSRPFDWLILDGKLVLYDNKSCAEQLRRQHQISVKVTRREIVGELFVCEGEGRTPNGRTDEATKHVSLLDKFGKRLTGNNLANAFAKAESGMKRRLTFSMIGMAAPPDPEEMRGARFVTVDGTGNVLADPTAEQKTLAADPAMARAIGEPTFEQAGRRPVTVPDGQQPNEPHADPWPDTAALFDGMPDQRARPEELERPKREGPPPSFRPSKADITKWRSEYFGAVSGTSYAEDDGRHDLVETWTDGRTGSLMTFLASATERQAGELIAHARNHADIERAERVIEADDRPEGMSERGHAAVEQVDGLEAETAPDERELPARPDATADYTRQHVLVMWSAWANAMRRLGGSYPFPDVTRLKTPELAHELGRLVRAVEDLDAAGAAPAEEGQDSSDSDSLAF